MTPEFSIPIKGLNTDMHEMNKESNTYSFCLNANIEDFTGENFFIGNDGSNILTVVLNEKENVIGKKLIVELNKILLFTIEGNVNRIREILPISYTDYSQNHSFADVYVEDIPLEQKPLVPISNTVILTEGVFEWKITHPVKIEYKRTDCTLNLYFNDKLNPDRYLYFDITNDKLSLNDNFKIQQGLDECLNPLYINELDVSKTNWYPTLSVPTSKINAVNGGNLKAGVYQVLFAYSTSKGIALSNYLSASNPFSIKTKITTVATDYLTTKALKIKIEKANAKYQYLNLVIAETISGFTTYKLAATLPTSVKEYIYTGNEKTIILTESDVFAQYPYYKFSEDIAIANNILFKSNLTEFTKINIQRIANKLSGKLKWVSVALKEGDFAIPEIAQKYRAYLRDEVYPFGIQLIFDRGEYTPTGVIPARTSTSFDNAYVINTPNIQDIVEDGENCNITQKKRWQVYNTASKTITHPLIYDECNPSIYEEGEFAYWESTDLYPNNPEIWGELCGKPIRHHKFPDALITNFHNGNTDVSVGFDEKNFIFPLGVKLDVNINSILDEALTEGLIDEETRNSIIGWRIVRGNRFGNESVEAKGLLYNTFDFQDEKETYTYPNYPFNDLRRDNFLMKRKADAQTVFDLLFNPDNVFQKYTPNRKYTFHSPETSFNSPSLGNILKLESEEYGTAKGFFNQCEDQAEYKLLSQAHYNLAIILGTILGEAVEFDDGSGQASNMGQGIGGIVGGAIGTAIAPGIGTSIGSGLGGILGGLVGGAISKNNDLEDFWRANVILSQCEKILQLFTLLAKGKNYAWQYQAVGKYSNSKVVPNNGNKQREILTSGYLTPSKQTISSTNTTTFFNNQDRESSVYLELKQDVSITSVQDTSRFTVRTSSKGCSLQANEEVVSTVSSYYGAIKRNILNQYGNVFSIQWFPTSDEIASLNSNIITFGGDTFIGRMSLKRKHSFFSRTAFKLADGTEIFYEDYPNIAHPTFFFNTRWNDDSLVNFTNVDDNPLMKMVINALYTGEVPDNIINNVVNVPRDEPNPLLLLIPAIGIPLFTYKKWLQPNVQLAAYLADIGGFFRGSLLSPYNFIRPPRYLLDCFGDSFGNLLPGSNSTWFNLSPVDGKMYLYSYGIPYFLCESSVNLDLRHQEDDLQKAFYPAQSNLNTWLQEKYVSSKENNYYSYNRDYSKQNKEQLIGINDINFSPYEDCKIERPNRVIFSQQGAEIEDNDLKDSYLNFKALDYFDFGLKNGKLIAINAIENEKILVRFENGSKLFSAYQTINTDVNTIAISNGDLFKSRPMDYAITDLGYLGTQHEAFVSTPFGHVSVDAKRGQVFQFNMNGTSPSEISNKGRKNWFKQNLPFTISKYIEGVPTDNSYLGIGILLHYDSRFNRLFLTKLDYQPLNSLIRYSSGKFYVENVEVYLQDKEYFCNKSWTTSYNFYTQSWVSMHSFTPNFYIANQNWWMSGLNGNGMGASSVWTHNLTNKSYQVYYGKLHPFIVDVRASPSIQNKKVIAVEYYLDVVRFHREFDKTYVKDKGFNKAVVSNRYQTTGLLFLKPNDKTLLHQFLEYPKPTLKGTEILVNKYKNGYQFNDILNKAKNDENNLPIWISSCNNVEKFVNLAAVNTLDNKISNKYIEGQELEVRLINDEVSNKKIIFKGLKIETT
jgi:hypothetical protein